MLEPWIIEQIRRREEERRRQEERPVLELPLMEYPPYPMDHDYEDHPEDQESPRGVVIIAV
jgi:hypothetical protein